MKINSDNKWGTTFTGILKKTAGNIKAGVDSFKSGMGAVESKEEFIPSGVQGEKLTDRDGITQELKVALPVSPQPNTEVSPGADSNPEEIQEKKGLSKEAKGALIGGGVGFILTGGLLGTGGGAWFGKEVAEHGFEGACEETGKKFGKAAKSVHNWFDETFGAGKNVETGTSTMDVGNGVTKVTVTTNTGTSKNAPQTLTMIE